MIGKKRERTARKEELTARIETLERERDGLVSEVDGLRAALSSSRRREPLTHDQRAHVVDLLNDYRVFGWIDRLDEALRIAENAA